MRVRHAAILDAGSSGTRIYIYRWEHYNDGDLAPPAITMIYTEEIEPGLSSIAALTQVTDNSTPSAEIISLISRQIATNLKPLLIPARQFLGPEILARTVPLFLLATAGLRYLVMHKKKPLLQQLRKYLSTCGFDTKECRVISGAEEAIYGWVAANYSLGHFSEYGLEADSTVGYVEMGGASMQIAFRPTAMEIDSYVVNNAEGEIRDNLKKIRTSIEPKIAAEKKSLKLNVAGIPAELYPTWTRMIAFFYGAGSANKAAFQAMTNVVKRVWTRQATTRSQFDELFEIIDKYEDASDSDTVKAVEEETKAFILKTQLPMTETEDTEWKRLVGLYIQPIGSGLKASAQLAANGIAKGRESLMSEKDLLEWYLAMKKPKLTKIMVAGKPFYIYRKSFPLGGNKMWDAHEAVLRAQGTATKEVVDQCMPTGYEGEIKAADGSAIKVTGGTGDLRNCLKAAYFQIRTVSLVAAADYPSLPTPDKWTSNNHGHRGPACPTGCTGGSCDAHHEEPCLGPCKCTMSDCPSAIYLLHNGPRISRSARQFVGGAHFYYSTRTIFGMNKHGQPRKKAYNFYDFSHEVNQMFVKDWDTVKKEMGLVKLKFLVRAWFTSALITTVLNEGFRISQDTRGNQIKFRPYNGSKKDEQLTWTLGRIVLWATGDEDIEEVSVSEALRDMELYREDAATEDSDAELTGYEEGDDSEDENLS